jgi:calcineurin-like phosphoesterase family protein
MVKIWFVADTHFGHANIIGYASRPFGSLEKMNEAMVRNWNSRVKKHDLVFHLGDFCFHNTENGKEGEGDMVNAEAYLERLNGHITFIVGNHDKNNSLNSIITYCVINYGGEEVFLTHNPEECNTKFRINLVGHVHGLWRIKRVKNTYLVNVGVDVWDFHPIDINEILAEIQKFKKEEKKG